MTIHKLAPNIPLNITAKYCDVVPGTYGPQVRFKGNINGEDDALLFLPGKAWANLKALKSAGVIPYDEVNEEAASEHPVKVELLAHDLTLTSKKGAGDKYATLEVIPKANGKPPIASALPTNPPKKYVPNEQDEAYIDSLIDGPPLEPRLFTFTDLTARYKECVDFASVAWGKDTSDVALVAAAATIFIERSRRGI